MRPVTGILSGMTSFRAFINILAAVVFCLNGFAQTPGPQAGGATETFPDERIRERIENIFAQVDDFRRIEVRVQSGVVTLTGDAPHARAREEALSLARGMDGVVLVLDRFEEGAAIAGQLSPALAKLRDLGETFLKRLPLIVIALATLALFAWLANFLYRRERWFGRLRLSALADTLARRLVRIAVVGVGMLLALEILNATAIVGALLGAAGVVGLTLGFAFKNILENYLSGILLSTRNPFDIGDEVEIRGWRGKIALLTARDTVLVTLDGNHLRVPNSLVINSELLNFTRNPRRRFEFVVGVSVDLDLNHARRVGLAALARNPAVLAYPRPAALVDNLGESAVNLKFLAWLDQSEHDFAKTRSESIRTVKEAFDQAGIEMPEPLYRIQLRNSAAALSRPAADTTEESEPPPQEAPPAPVGADEIALEDVAVDDTIDRQIEEDRRESQEENLLPEPEKD